MGEREITARSDVYALGAMTYEMLVGDPPFTGSTAQAIVAKVMTERPRPIHPQRDTVPAAVEDAVLTALEKLPADRFATAAQFAEALHAPSGTGRTRVSTGARARGAAGASGGWRGRLRDPVVLGLAGIAAACAIAGRLGLAATAGRIDCRRRRPLHHSGAAERQHQRARLQHHGRVTGRPDAGLRQPGRRPPPAADDPPAGRGRGAAAARDRGRGLSDLFPRRTLGGLHPRQPGLQGRRSTGARLRPWGWRRARSSAPAGRRPG